MHKPSTARMGILAQVAATLGLQSFGSTAQVLNKQRGKAPAGQKWRYSGVYIPGGETRNVEPTTIKNPKIAAHVQMMHDKWWANRTARHNMKAMQEIVP